MAGRFRVCGVGLGRLFLSVAALLLLPSLAHPRTGYRPELKPYVAFVDHQKTSAKDYVLGLFETHDLVILCERFHPEITQYDLFLSIIRDPRFIDSVGNVFTEIGTITQAPEVNAFVHAEGLSADSVDRAVLRFQRNCSDSPMWEKTNYAGFIRSLYTLNQDLPGPKKVDLFNSDVPFDWNTIDTAGLRTFQEHLGDVRDSIMASQIIRKYEEIRTSRAIRRKALVIMNYRHAFRHDFVNPSGVKRENVGRFLFERYPGRVANVYINSVALVSARSDNDVTWTAIQDGKWDAAFSIRKVRDRGFDFKDSPFGRDGFDIWPVKTDRFQDEFDGFVFYLPLDEHKAVIGMPGFIDSTFGAELVRRYALYSTLGGRWRPLTDIEAEKRQYNERREFPPYQLDSLDTQIQKWFQP